MLDIMPNPYTKFLNSPLCFARFGRDKECLHSLLAGQKNFRVHELTRMQPLIIFCYWQKIRFIPPERAKQVRGEVEISSWLMPKMA